MNFAYQPDEWHDFYAALATTYAAFMGLFFVAISLHPRQIGEHPLLRSRARITLVGVAMLLIAALCCLVPHQSPQALGIELAVVWSVWAVVLTFNQVALIIRLDPVPAGVWLRTVTALVMSAFGIFAGISLWLIPLILIVGMSTVPVAVLSGLLR
jgi:hypothetical protein